ncbi:hypothetical protein Lal_00012416 [Lupinus albus]|nr:hypothetical protein Lal_00012416 [Lupinus albus]
MVTTQTLVTQKRKPRGVSSMKSVVHARSKNMKCLRDANGDVNLKPPSKYANLIDETDWMEFVIYRTQDAKFLKISEENRKRASNPLYPYRAS